MSGRGVVLSPESIRLAGELWAAGCTLDELCQRVGISRDVLVERRRPGRELAFLERRRRGVNSRASRFADPTPGEIAERTAEIRSGWSEAERLNRSAAPGAPVDSWTGERLGGRVVSMRRPRRGW